MPSAICSSAREGKDATARGVALGSHLDTVPTGGRFDGVFGVLAGLDVMRALDEANVRTRAPLELVNWTNEEGSRFRPAMMGSRVHAGDMVLEDALAITDDKGASVREALRASDQAGPLTPSPRGWACWLKRAPQPNVTRPDAPGPVRKGMSEPRRPAMLSTMATGRPARQRRAVAADRNFLNTR
jgi:Peptidase family M20/M25/M40